MKQSFNQIEKKPKILGGTRRSRKKFSAKKFESFKT